MENINEQPNEVSMTLRDYVQVLFRQKAVVLVSIITVLITAFIGLKMQSKMYEASVKMLITAEKQIESPYYKESMSSRSAEQTITQSEIVVSDPVLMRVVNAQDLKNRPLDEEKNFSSEMRAKVISIRADFLRRQIDVMPPRQKEAFLLRRAKENLKSSIKVDPIRDTNMFTIKVRDYNPVGAAILANTVSRAYIIFDLEQQLAELRQKYGDRHPKIVYIRENIAKMQTYLNGQPLEDIDAIGPASVKIIEQASVPIQPSGSSKTITFILALVMSIFLGVMLAFIFEYADQTVKLPRDIARITGIPYLASVRRPGLFAKLRVDFSGKTGVYARSYMDMCEQLYLMWKQRGVAVVMVASTLKKEKTHEVMINMAGSLVHTLKLKVLLVDADFRTPALAGALKVKAGKALVDYLENKAAARDVVYQVAEGYSVVPAGVTTLNPILLFNSGRMSAFIDEVRKDFDLVLIRSSAMRGHRDPSILAQFTDTVLVVVEEGKVRRQVIAQALAEVQSRARSVTGVLLINRSFPVPKWIYELI